MEDPVISKLIATQAKSHRNLIIGFGVLTVALGSLLVAGVHTATERVNSLRDSTDLLRERTRALEIENEVAMENRFYEPDTVLVGLDPQRRAVVLDALRLLRQKPPILFKWGGKTPEEGFDSSGFIAYVLAHNGVITSSVRGSIWLQKEFMNVRLDTNRLSESARESLLPGDIVFYKNGLCMMYLDDRTTVGMYSWRIRFHPIDLSFFDVVGAARMDYSRVRAKPGRAVL